MAGITYRVGSEDIPAYRAQPTGDGPWPGVVLVHEAWGLDDVMRRLADRLACMGYLTLAPDLFSRGSAFGCMISVFRNLRAGNGPAFADLEGARQTLLDDASCTGRVGIIGFCMGGGYALMCAERGYDVAAPFYGMYPADGQVLRRACPVVASYGGRDSGLANVAPRLERALTDFGVEHDVKVYPEAGHAFMNDERNGPRVLRPLMSAMHAGPDPEAAEDAWRRVDNFFDRHLRRAGRG